jgi:hypothetical protein
VKREGDKAQRHTKPKSVADCCFASVCQRGGVSIHPEKMVVLNIDTSKSYSHKAWWPHETVAIIKLHFFFFLLHRLEKFFTTRDIQIRLCLQAIRVPS